LSSRFGRQFLKVLLRTCAQDVDFLSDKFFMPVQMPRALHISSRV
jgi:hypothetical protein